MEWFALNPKLTVARVLDWEGSDAIRGGWKVVQFRSRLAGAVDAIRGAIASISDWSAEQILEDDDLADDLLLDELDLEILGLILEEIFAIPEVPEQLWQSPLFRTPASLAEWCIRHSEDAAWREAKRVA